MRTLLLTAVAAAAAFPLPAQSNAVPGIDARIYQVGDVGAFGRRGPAFPNGEAGFGVGHSYCNAGTINIPWASTSGGVMIDTYPKIAFLLARELNGRMSQISGRSFLKHSRTPFNFASGPCAPCTSSGGPFMFTGCSDTYGSSTNINRFNLGPTDEIDPWLGTWNAVGSYFDRGDPAVAGAAASDGVQSLSSAQISAFDAIKNMVVVRESDLVAGGQLYGQVHLMIQGEPLANRANNLMSRPCTIAWNGTQWTASAAGTSLEGSVLNQWSGATVAIGDNAPNDGRFAIGVKVTGPVGGIWHYEYAVHNLDNARGGASLRIPVDAAATVSGAGFRDLDVDVLNDWSFTRTTNEIAFTAGASNALDWNTIYNFWFDCSVAPSLGQVLIDEARNGPGALTVGVASEAPNGIPSARVQPIGHSCGQCANSFYEFFATAAQFDLSNRALTMVLNGNQYTVQPGGPAFVPPAGTPLVMSLDSSVAVPIPFALPFPGGTTSTLHVCSKAFISTATGNGTTFTPSVQTFLTGVPRWAVAWHDFNVPGGGQVLVDANSSRVIVTFDHVVSFGAQGTNTFQAQFQPNGTVAFVWQALAGTGNPFLVGFSPGSGSTDSGNRDLSAQTAPFTLCGGVFRGLTLAASARPILGTSVTLTIQGVPSGSDWAALALSPPVAAPLDLTPYGMEGCELYVTLGNEYVTFLPGPNAPTTLAVPNDPALLAAVFAAQGFAWSPPLTSFGAIASNGLILTTGL